MISCEDNRDCHITMPLSLKTMEVQINGAYEIRDLERCRTTGKKKCKMLFFLKTKLIMSAHVGSRLIFFLSVEGNFLLVLSVVSDIFSPFVASLLTPFTPA